jgi:hypothetical protein
MKSYPLQTIRFEKCVRTNNQRVDIDHQIISKLAAPRDCVSALGYNGTGEDTATNHPVIVTYSFFDFSH